MSIREYTALLCPSRLLTFDALQDTRPHPRRIVYTVFGIGMMSTFYFGIQSIPWAFVGSLLATELLFRSMIFGFLLVHIYVRVL
jgi:hypothetical protein